MKKIILISLLLGVVSSLYSQVKQIGIIRELNSNGKPISGVAITCLSDKDVQPTISDKNGIFILHFDDKKAGDILYNLRIYKQDYEIVNNHILKYGWTLTQKDTIRIILANKNILSQTRAKYYNIIDQFQIKKYKSTTDSLKKALEFKNISLEEYSLRAEDAERELSKAYTKIEEYADLLAKINKDDMDSITKEAFEYFENGNISKAISLYEKNKLIEQLKTKVSLRNASNESINHLIPKLQEEVNYRLMASGEENITKAQEILEEIANVDTTNLYYVNNYIQFLMEQEKFDKALEWSNKAEKNLKSSDDKNSLYQTRGHILYKQKKFEQSEDYLIKSIQALENTKTQDTNLYMQNMSLSLNTLGNLYFDLDEFEKAEKALKDAVGIREELSKKDSTTLIDYATVLTNLGDLYTTTNQNDKAIIYLSKAIEIEKELVKHNYQLYAHKLGNSLNTLGVAYFNKEDYEKAKINYISADSILESLFALNPNFYGEKYIVSLNNLGYLYKIIKDNQKAEEYYIKAINICNERAKDNPELYNYYSASIMNNMATNYRAQNLYDKAIDYNNRALKIRTDLLLFSKKYIAEVAQSNFNLGRVYFSMKDYEKAEPYYIKSKDIFYELCKTKAAAYKPIYALTVFNLGILYAEKKDKKEAKKHYKKAKKAYSELEKEKKGEYIDNIKSVNKYLDELRQK